MFGDYQLQMSYKNYPYVLTKQKKEDAMGH